MEQFFNRNAGSYRSAQNASKWWSKQCKRLTDTGSSRVSTAKNLTRYEENLFSLSGSLR